MSQKQASRVPIYSCSSSLCIPCDMTGSKSPQIMAFPFSITTCLESIPLKTMDIYDGTFGWWI